MLTTQDGPFINVSRLNLPKYASDERLSRALFEYILYHENDVRTAMQFAAHATQAVHYKSWYWKVALGKCYLRCRALSIKRSPQKCFMLGLYRDAEKQFKSAQAQEPMIDTTLFLAKVYIRLDQPLSAIEVYSKGLDTFARNSHLFTALARIHESLNDMDISVNYYKQVLKEDAMNVEAIACIGTHHFYADTPEIALCFYR